MSPFLKTIKSLFITFCLYFMLYQIYCFPYLLKADTFLFLIFYLYNFSFIPLPVMELGYLLKILRVILLSFCSLYLKSVFIEWEIWLFIFSMVSYFLNMMNHFCYSIMASSIFFEIQQEFIRFLPSSYQLHLFLILIPFALSL